jgi:hypothetical protein
LILTHIVFHEFLTGIGSPAAEPEPEPEPVVEIEATRPRPDDGGSRKTLHAKRRNIFKPTGLIDRKPEGRAGVEQRVRESQEIADEIAEALARGPEPLPEPKLEPRLEFTPAQVDAEIGRLLRKHMRTDEDELILLLLMAASAAC